MKTLASRAATGIELVLPNIHIRFIKDSPVEGSSISAKSLNTSTASPARSPQAAIIIISARAYLHNVCCRTVFPAPKGPGFPTVPP